MKSHATMNSNFGVFNDLMNFEKMKTYHLSSCYIKDGFDKNNIRLDLIKPFLFFSNSNKFHPILMIFAQNYECIYKPKKSVVTVILKSKYNNNDHKLIFSSKIEATEFNYHYGNSITKLDKYLEKVSPNKLTSIEQLNAYFPKINKVVECNCMLLRIGVDTYSLQAHTHNQYDEMECIFDFEFDLNSIVTPLFKRPEMFGRSSLTTHYFMITTTDMNDNYGIFQCSSFEQCARWILSIYGWIQLGFPKVKEISSVKSRKFSPFLKNTISNKKIPKEETRNLLDQNISLVVEDIDNTKSSENQNSNNNHNIESKGLQSDESNNFLTPKKNLRIVTTNLGSHTISSPLSPSSLFSPSAHFSSCSSPKGNNFQSSPAQKRVSTASSPNKNKIQPRNDEHPMKREDSSPAIVQNRELIKSGMKMLDEKFLEMKNNAELQDLHKLELPNASRDLVYSKSFDDHPVDDIIQHLVDSLINNYKVEPKNVENDHVNFISNQTQTFFDKFEPYQQISTEDIINKIAEDQSRENQNELRKLNRAIEENLNKNNFPNFNFNLLLLADSHAVPIINEFSCTLQAIQIQSQQIVFDNPLFERLCFLISAIFLNGLNGFDSFTAECDFLKSVEELTPFVDGLYSIYSIIKNFDDLTKQISIYCIHLFNNQLLLQTIKAIMNNEDWKDKFYRLDSYIHDELTMNFVYTILDISISNLIFKIQDSDSIFTNISLDDKNIFLFSLPFSYLECNSIKIIGVDHKTARTNVVQYVMNQLKDGYTKKTPWEFLLEVANSDNVKDCDEFKEFQKYVKEIPRVADNNSKLKKVINHGVITKTLHLWFAFMFTNTTLTEKYYREGSSLRDYYRIKYIFSYILKFLSL